MVCGCGTIAYTHGTVHRAELSTGLCCSAAHSSDATPIPTRSPGCRHPRHTLAPPSPPPDAYPSLSVRHTTHATLPTPHHPRHTTHATPPTSLCRRSSPHHCGCGSRSPCHRRRRKAREHVMAVALHACIGAPRQPSCNEKAFPTRESLRVHLHDETFYISPLSFELSAGPRLP